MVVYTRNRKTTYGCVIATTRKPCVPYAEGDGARSGGKCRPN
jgi:hypothetical protein